MTYAARDDTTLPKLLAQMRWVVLVDKRQLAVLLARERGTGRFRDGHVGYAR